MRTYYVTLGPPHTLPQGHGENNFTFSVNLRSPSSSDQFYFGFRRATPPPLDLLYQAVRRGRDWVQTFLSTERSTWTVRAARW